MGREIQSIYGRRHFQNARNEFPCEKVAFIVFFKLVIKWRRVVYILQLSMFMFFEPLDPGGGVNFIACRSVIFPLRIIWVTARRYIKPYDAT